MKRREAPPCMQAHMHSIQPAPCMQLHYDTTSLCKKPPPIHTHPIKYSNTNTTTQLFKPKAIDTSHVMRTMAHSPSAGRRGGEGFPPQGGSPVAGGGKGLPPHEGRGWYHTILHQEAFQRLGRLISLHLRHCCGGVGGAAVVVAP